MSTSCQPGVVMRSMPLIDNDETRIRIMNAADTRISAEPETWYCPMRDLLTILEKSVNNGNTKLVSKAAKIQNEIEDARAKRDDGMRQSSTMMYDALKHSGIDTLEMNELLAIADDEIPRLGYSPTLAQEALLVACKTPVSDNYLDLEIAIMSHTEAKSKLLPALVTRCVDLIGACAPSRRVTYALKTTNSVLKQGKLTISENGIAGALDKAHWEPRLKYAARINATVEQEAGIVYTLVNNVARMQTDGMTPFDAPVDAQTISKDCADAWLDAHQGLVDVSTLVSAVRSTTKRKDA